MRTADGEAEFVLLVGKDEVYVAAGSDHTDRKLEAESAILKGKQIYPNIISRAVWRLCDVEDHWDDIVMRAWVDGDPKHVYQEAKLSALFRPQRIDGADCAAGGRQFGRYRDLFRHGGNHQEKSHFTATSSRPCWWMISAVRNFTAVIRFVPLRGFRVEVREFLNQSRTNDGGHRWQKQNWNSLIMIAT